LSACSYALRQGELQAARCDQGNPSHAIEIAIVMARHNSDMPAWKERLGHTHRRGNLLVLSPRRKLSQLAVSRIRCGFGGHRLIPPGEVVFTKTRLR